MRHPKSVRLVIDACVARAAGGEDAEHPKSKTCRDFLISVLEVCHRAVMSPEVYEEWKNHQSGFARRWRVGMVARKKIHFQECRENEMIRQEIERAAPTQTALDVMMKDIHLVENALATDKRIVSLDQEARNHFHRAAAAVRKLRLVVWVNPKIDEEAPISWLERGAPDDRERRLGYEPGA
jgi:hypothetical protein